MFHDKMIKSNKRWLWLVVEDEGCSHTTQNERVRGREGGRQPLSVKLHSESHTIVRFYNPETIFATISHQPVTKMGS